MNEILAVQTKETITPHAVYGAILFVCRSKFPLSYVGPCSSSILLNAKVERIAYNLRGNALHLDTMHQLIWWQVIGNRSEIHKWAPMIYDGSTDLDSWILAEVMFGVDLLIATAAMVTQPALFLTYFPSRANRSIVSNILPRLLKFFNFFRLN